jgi:UDP-glucose 4-epimerase
VNHTKLKYKISEPRKGDLPLVFAKVDKAYSELGWKAEKTLEDMCKI